MLDFRKISWSKKGALEFVRDGACLSVPERSEGTEVSKIAIQRCKYFGGARILALRGAGLCKRGCLGVSPPFDGATSTPPRWAHNGDAPLTGTQTHRSL